MQEQVRSLTARVEKADVVTDRFDESLTGLNIRARLTGRGQHVEYIMIVDCAGRTHECRKRFSDFAYLHDFLKRRFPLGLTFDLPSKTPIRHFSLEAIEDRKNCLNSYLKEMCRYTELINLPQVLAFFGVFYQRRISGRAGGYSGQDDSPLGVDRYQYNPFVDSRPLSSKDDWVADNRDFYDKRCLVSDYDAYNSRGNAARGSQLGMPVKVHGARGGRLVMQQSDDSDDDLAGWDN